jgi:hypothetical protein
MKAREWVVVGGGELVAFDALGVGSVTGSGVLYEVGNLEALATMTSRQSKPRRIGWARVGGEWVQIRQRSGRPRNAP